MTRKRLESIIIRKLKKFEVVTWKKLKQSFKPSRSEKKTIKKILEELEQKGKIVSFGYGKKFIWTKKLPVAEGILDVTPEGFGFVLTGRKNFGDVYIAPHNIGDAIPGDRVEVAIFPFQSGKNPEGKIIKILDRKLKRTPAVLIKKIKKDLFVARGMQEDFSFDVLLDLSGVKDKEREFRIGDVCIVYPQKLINNSLFEATFSKFLGHEEEVKVQEEIVKLIHDIPTTFSEDSLRQAKKLPQKFSSEDLKGRKDLTSLDFVTIDGSKARDFDDAIFVKKEKDRFKLYVAIADVTHYVPINSPLDKEARQRGNSFYFPCSVEPMFPFELSNELCSLKPNEDRLVMCVEMDFNKKGERVSERFYPAVIKSKARLTYSQVKKVLVDKEEEHIKELGSLVNMLKTAEELALILRGKRDERGSIDFDIPEPEMLIGMQEEILNIKPKEVHIGHKIIEEFMIAANEAVAEYLYKRDFPCIFRVHPNPDESKLRSLFSILEKTSIGQDLPSGFDPKSLQYLLKLVKDKDIEFLVNRLLLRSMMQAFYSPVLQYHFGLASECYCHFTSPIRRYADIMVHRFLKLALGIQKEFKMKPKKLEKISDHISNQERKALAAEREIFKRIVILFLKDKIGEEFEGVISSLADFGFWVELKNIMADGLVKISSLTDDYYIFFPEEHKFIGRRFGKIFTIGQKVRVKLIGVDLHRLEIDLALLSTN